MIGQPLAHYEVTSRLGAGGMGEVYRASDRKLGREIALKVLPEEVAGDPQRLARFRQEARSLAALDHPGIVTVFSIEEEEGVTFLTMELVEGHTLADLIAPGGLDLETFFEVALELVDAVAAAHQGGVVHRDLKPSNVMRTREGRIKVLDFGLAKTVREPDIGHSATTELLTEEHKVVGTPVYMSPEQLQGRPADHRADIFALGILLYQLATGRHPFGDDASLDTVSSILKTAPRAVTERNAELPPQLARILDRCLEKEPEKRLQSARDLGFALEDLRQMVSEGNRADGGAAPAARSRPSLRWALVATGLLVAVAAFWLGQRTSGPSTTGFAEVPNALPVVTWPSTESSARLSPDGAWLSYISDRGGSEDLWIQRVDGGGARVVPGATGVVRSHVWSGAGDEIAMLTGEEGDKRIEIVPAPLGGRPRLSLAAPRHADELVDWRGRRILVEGHGRLTSFDLDSAESVDVELTDNGFAHRRHFDSSADGTELVFSALREGRENLWSERPGDGMVTPLTDDDSIQVFPHCLGPGCGEIAYVSNRTGQTDVWILDRRQGGSRQLRVPAAVYRIDDVSSDGSLLALSVVDEDANLWIHENDESRGLPLTADTLADFEPAAAAGSGLVAFQRSLPGTELAARFLDSRIHVAERTASDQVDPRPVGGRGYAPEVSPEGTRVAYLRTSLARGRPPFFTELWLAELDSGRQRLLGDGFQMNGYFEFPATLMGRNLVWRGEGELLFVFASEEAVPEIRRLDLSAEAKPAESLYRLERRGLILDLTLSRDGDLGFLTSGFSEGPRELRVLSGDGVRTLHEAPGLRLAGLSPAGEWILLRALGGPTEPGPLEVLAVDGDRGVRSLVRLERAVAATAVLAPSGRRLYLTRVTEEGAVLAAVEPSTGRSWVVRAADLPGVVFTGITPLADGHLIYSEQRRNADLWLLRRGGGSANHRTSSMEE